MRFQLILRNGIGPPNVVFKRHADWHVQEGSGSTLGVLMPNTDQTNKAANQKNNEPQNNVVRLTDSLPASRAMTYTHCMRARYSVRNGQKTSRFGELGRLNETNDTQTDRQLR